MNESESRRRADRMAPYRVGATVAGVVLTLATLVWGAARISSTVDNLNLVVTNLQATTEALRSTITGILVHEARNDADIEALKARLRAPPTK